MYPTFRQAAKRFRTTLDEIERAIEDYRGEGYLGAAVALGIPGVGVAEITPRGEYQIETYV